LQDQGIDYNELVISSDENTGINILTPNTKSGTIAFGDPQSSNAGFIQYNHSTDELVFGRDSLPVMSLNPTGLSLGGGGIRMDVAGANDFVITEEAANVMRLGSSGTANGLSIDLISGKVTAYNGLEIAGGTITGTVDVSDATGVLALANGGTGASTAPDARTNLGLGALATQDKVDGADWDNAGTDLAIAGGGTGADNAAGARDNLGLEIGVDIQGFSAHLQAISGLVTTAFGRSLLTAADAAGGRALLGAIGLVSANFGANTLDIRFALDGGRTLMIQAGISTAASGAIGVVAFPTPYSMPPFAMVNGGNAVLTDEADVHNHSAPTATSISYNNGGSSGQFTWIAIGLL